MNKVLVLFGPTASGKTALLEKLFVKKRICPAEIISADSMQVYRGMDIGTAKPSPEERAKIPHHLIDIKDPKEQFNAGEFVRLAREAARAALKRGVLPVVSGGTGFYLKNLIMGLPESPPSDPALRTLLKEELEEKGAAAMMKELVSFDPVSAGRIHINDSYRLLRALEVLRLTGRPLSSYAQSGGTENAGELPDFEYLVLGLRREREDLYSRIGKRCTEMFRLGLPDEARRLYETGYTPLDPGLRAIGYKEFFIENTDYTPAPEGEREPKDGGNLYRFSRDFAGAEALIARNSRHYAKRQLVFFASLPGVTWIGSGAEDEAVQKIERLTEEFLGKKPDKKS